MNSNKIVVTGTVEFVWHSSGDEHALVNIDTDMVGVPHTFEIPARFLEQLEDDLDEGQRIEIVYLSEGHEVVDPDSATTSERQRPNIQSVRIVDH